MNLRTAALLSLLAACAARGPLDEARERHSEGRGEEALTILLAEMQRHPGDSRARAEYRAEYFRLRDVLVGQWLAQADVLRQAGQFSAAEALYRRAQVHDSANPRVAAGLAQNEADRRHSAVVTAAAQLVQQGKDQEAQELLRPVLADDPRHREARRLQRIVDERLAKPVGMAAQLRPSSLVPISFDLRDVTVRNVFEVLQRASGVSFFFDRDVRAEQRTSIAVRDASIEEAIRMVLLTNQLEQKVLGEKTVFIYPNMPQKLREHQELVVKGFYLSNADVKQTANMIRTLLKTRDVFIDEKISLIVIKDTPTVVRLAEQLIAAQDLADPEVMLELEVMEVSRNRLQELGIRFPDTLAIGVQGAAGVPGTVTLREWRESRADVVQLSFSNPLFLLALKQQDGYGTVLANPRVRVKNKDKARIHIGDRVPVITTTAAATGGFISESVTYLDVGLKLEVEPVISLDDEIGIKVGLEVSNIVREVKSSSNTLTYQIGTRTAATNLRLRDGETQVLAGLINSEDRRSADRVPGLGELPVAGRLFSHTLDNNNRTEIVLLITPRLLRTLARPGASAMEFAAGTDASMGGRLGAVPFVPPPPGEAAGVTPGAPAAAQPAQPAQPIQPAQPPAPSTPLIVPFGGVKPALP